MQGSIPFEVTIGLLVVLIILIFIVACYVYIVETGALGKAFAYLIALGAFRFSIGMYFLILAILNPPVWVGDINEDFLIFFAISIILIMSALGRFVRRVLLVFGVALFAVGAYQIALQTEMIQSGTFMILFLWGGIICIALSFCKTLDPVPPTYEELVEGT